MSVAKAGSVALVLAMLLACASDLGETSAPPAGIPHPELAELEPPLARELEARRAGLDALLADEAATAKEQAQAFGELGRLYQAEESLARSGTTRVAMADPLMHELTTLAIGASPHLARGNAAAREGRLAEAESAYRQAVAADAANPRAHQSLGTVLVRRGNPQAALEHFGAAVALEPENARAHSDLGVLLGELGQNDRALEHLGRAVELEPGLVQALLSLGNVQARIGRLDESEATYRRVLESDTGNGDARLGLGAVLAQTGDFEQAVVELQEALRHEPGDERASRIHFGLAEALVRTGQLEEALAHYTRVREIDPDQGLAWLREATVLMGLERFADAKGVLEARLAVAPADDRAAHSLARLLAGAPDPSLRDGPRALAIAGVCSKQTTPRPRPRPPRWPWLKPAASRRRSTSSAPWSRTRGGWSERARSGVWPGTWTGTSAARRAVRGWGMYFRRIERTGGLPLRRSWRCRTHHIRAGSSEGSAWSPWGCP